MKTIIITMLFVISTNAAAETIDEKRHRTAPYARGIATTSKNQISREQYTLIAHSMASNYKNDLDNKGRKLFIEQIVKDNGCTITPASSEQGTAYLITCPHNSW